MTAAEIAQTLGRAHRSGAWWRCHCPVHASRGATLALRDGERGLILRCFADCDPREILAELRRRGLVTGADDGGRDNADRRGENRRGDHDDAARRIAWARQIWDRSRDPRGSPVVPYLLGRGLTMPLPPPLRWAPACRHPSGINLPAMVARVEHVERGFVGCHRTYLTADYRRRDRASLGPIGGGAVRLATMRPNDWLVIGEGIETVMSVMQCEALAGWAALSAGGIERLLLPSDARMVLIVADHDPNGTGERAAHNAARRWLREGRRVRIALPPYVGEDANDLLIGSHSVAA
jgi:putative DNA primase/helicase